MEDVCITLIEKTNPFILSKSEDYCRKSVKALAPHDLNIGENVQCFGLYLMLLTRF